MGALGMGALNGVVVADFSRVLAGPYAAMTLGDLGAEVIKVERPGAGDDTRVWGPPWEPGDAEAETDGPPTATYYSAMNRNKRSITLDLDNPDDQRVAVRLATKADVLVENFRPGTLHRFGLGYPQLRDANPGLVYCSITGFGSAPEASDLSGYDLLVQAMSGLMSITGDEQGPPMKVGVAMIDHVTALQATTGILAALVSRAATGLGQHVEVSLLGSALAALLNQGSGYLGAGVVPHRMGNRHPSLVPYEVFKARDGWLVVACGNDRQFGRIANLVGRPDLATDARFATGAARVANRDALAEILGDALASRSVGRWVAAFTEVGVPAGPINDVAAAFRAGAAVGLDPICDLDGFRSTRSPIGLSDTPTSVRRPPPGLGEHDAELRAWIEAD